MTDMRENAPDAIERLRLDARHNAVRITGYDARAILDHIAALTAERDAAVAEVARLRGAISWIEPPFVDAATSHGELKCRVGFCVADAKRAARAHKESGHVAED